MCCNILSDFLFLGITMGLSEKATNISSFSLAKDTHSILSNPIFFKDFKATFRWSFPPSITMRFGKSSLLFTSGVLSPWSATLSVFELSPILYLLEIISSIIEKSFWLDVLLILNLLYLLLCGTPSINLVHAPTAKSFPKFDTSKQSIVWGIFF